MEGISKARLMERLEDWLNEKTIDKQFCNGVIYALETAVDECTELNPWLPIDENTPKDRRIILFFPKYGSYDGGYLMTRRDDSVVFAASASLSVPLGVDATHWQELPEDPK